MKTFIGIALLLVAAAHAAAAQDADADRYRGGWRTDDSDPHVYEFSIRGERVRGIYCTLCSDATTLALHPDLVLVWDSGTPEPVIEKLRSLGLRVERITTSRLEDIATAIRRISTTSSTLPSWWPIWRCARAMPSACRPPAAPARGCHRAAAWA